MGDAVPALHVRQSPSESRFHACQDNGIDLSLPGWQYHTEFAQDARVWSGVDKDRFSMRAPHESGSALPDFKYMHLKYVRSEEDLIDADIRDDEHTENEHIERRRQSASHVVHFNSMTYSPKTFNLPALAGISEKQIKVHLALYEGYVKHTNLIMEKIRALKEADAEGNAYIVAELRRRFGFEFDGMRMHEYYFEQLEGGAEAINPDSALASAVAERYGEQGLEAHVREVAASRGIGWVVVYADPAVKTLHTVFVNDHELGQLAGLPVILALDLWEHAFMVDYVPAEKKNYIDAFFANLNWSIIEKRFDATI